MKLLDLGWLYDNWAKMCLYIAAYMLLLLCVFYPDIDFLMFLLWLQVPLYMLHQHEEHAWPGGFKDYVNKNVFKVSGRDVPLNKENIFWINIPVVWVWMPLFAGLARIDILFGVWLPFFAAFNGLTHILASLVKREYSPGFAVNFFLGVPISAFTIWKFYEAGILTGIVALVCTAIAILLHLIVIGYIGSQARKNKNPGK